jgi:LacI family transcriptional regulator
MADSSTHPRPRAPTIIDVARRAGTSKSTVSNVLQGKEHVQAATRARVLEAIDALGYRMNVAARHLRQRPNVLGVMMGDLRNPFHAEMAVLIEQYAYAAGHTILLVTTDGSPEREAQRIQALVEHRVGAVLFAAFSGKSAVLDLIPPETPRVFVSFANRAGRSVTVNERLGARLAVEHLLALGHTRIGYASTSLEHEPPRSDQARYAGYRRTLAAHGIDTAGLPSVRIVGEADAPANLVREQLMALLTGRDRPTAVFAYSDFTAIEVMEAADAVGLEIPRDLSVVGFDDVGIARIPRIALTTVAQPMAKIAERAVRIAVTPQDGGPLPRSRDVRLDPTLVVRGSTAPPVRSSARRRRPAVAR